MPIHITSRFNVLRTLGARLVYGSPLLFCLTYAQADQVTLAWDPGTSSEFTGYRLYYGQASSSYTSNVDVQNQTTYTLDNLSDGETYYFAVTAYGYDNTGQFIQSNFSNVVCKNCSLWSAGTMPGVLPGDTDTAAVELGIKFKADTNGLITGLRFYKDSANSGTHIGNLWSNDNGQLLATATFTNETESGWQQVNFTPPVPITANTVYIASYHTDTGHYNRDDYYFSERGEDNPPLHTLVDSGVFAYGSSSSFPNDIYQSRNYWVDVVFTSQ